MPNKENISIPLDSVIRFAMVKNSHGKLLTNYWLFERQKNGVMTPTVIEGSQVNIGNIIIDILRDRKMTQTDVIREIFDDHKDIGIGEKTLKRRIQDMIDSGILLAEEGKRSSKILALNPDREADFCY